MIPFCLINSYATSELRTMDEVEEREKKDLKDNSGSVITRPKVAYGAEDSRDPFWDYLPKEETEKTAKANLKSSEPVLPALKVQGIIWGGNFPQAIINNNVLKIGDTIEGAKIIKIDKAGIMVSYGGREYELSSPAKGNLEGLKKTDRKP